MPPFGTLVAAPLLLILLVSCASSPSSRRADGPGELRRALGKGLELYDEGELVLAAAWFEEAAQHAQKLEDRTTARDATAAACVAWMRARQLAEFSSCAESLEGLQVALGVSDPGINVLIAFGAIAAARPPPHLAIPEAIGEVLLLLREANR